MIFKNSIFILEKIFFVIFTARKRKEIGIMRSLKSLLQNIDSFIEMIDSIRNYARNNPWMVSNFISMIGYILKFVTKFLSDWFYFS